MSLMDEMLDQAIEAHKALAPRIKELMAKDPKLPHYIALVIAGDEVERDRAYARIREGEDWKRQLSMTGSYGRLDLALWLVEDQVIQEEDLFPMLPEIWCGSDPDDTDERFKHIWEAAWKANGRETITDGVPLPSTEKIFVYRGQDEGEAIGIAWTLDLQIAQRFASGMATRQGNRAGVVYKASIKRKRIYAYLTSRGEDEVVLDPEYLLV